MITQDIVDLGNNTGSAKSISSHGYHRKIDISKKNKMYYAPCEESVRKMLIKERLQKKLLKRRADTA